MWKFFQKTLSTKQCRQVHIPVLLKESISYLLSSKPNAIYIDATFGHGGYTRSILSRAPQSKVLAIDVDAIATKKRVQDFKSNFGERFLFYHGNFADLRKFVCEAFGEGVGVDGIVFDLGVSSEQLDQGERGFSFRKDGPLDMRMDPTSNADSAADVVNNISVHELEKIIREYGEESRSQKIANAIVKYRDLKRITTTEELAWIVRGVYPTSFERHGKYKIDVCTKTFQALRIFVNDELNMLKKALVESAAVLNPKGRLCVVSYHSLEDRIVKKFSQSREDFTAITKRVITPSKEEIAVNPRSRSAKLRVLEKLDASSQG